MKTFRVLLAVLTLIMGASSRAASADPADDVMAAIEAYAAAYNAHDAETALTFYSEVWRKDANAKEDLKENFAGGILQRPF